MLYFLGEFFIGIAIGFGLGIKENKTLDLYIDEYLKEKEDPADWWKKGKCE